MSEESNAQESNESASNSLDSLADFSDIGNDSNESSSSFNISINDDLKTKPYMQSILESENPGERLIQEFHNAQQLIGKKGIIPPGENASDEDIENFYRQLGRPDDPAEYSFEHPESEDYKVDEDFESAIKGIMHNAGLSKDQAARLKSGYDKYVLDRIENEKKSSAEKQELEAEQFEKQLLDKFGDNKDKVIRDAKVIINSMFSSQEDASKFIKMFNQSNESALAFLDLTKNIKDKFMSPDRMPTNKDASHIIQDDLPTQRRKLQKEFAEASRARNFRDMEIIQNKLDKLYGIVDK